MDKYYLYPSMLYASKTTTAVTTVLGSCVAVCIYDSVTEIGGINHYMLPLWNGSGLASPKYGDIAITKLVEKVISLGAARKNLVAKVFGGSTKINHFYNIGERNIELAHEILNDLAIPVIAHHTGGNFSRKMIFNTQTGEVKLKLLKGLENKNPSLKYKAS